MVKITNGDKIITVSQGSYNMLYKDLGYNIVREKDVKVVSDETKEEEQKDSLIEKPISEWTKNEVKKFAQENDIDISQTKNPAEAKNIISNWLKDNR